MGGVFIHAMPPLLQYLMGPGGISENTKIHGQSRQWDVHFRRGVLPAVLAADFGFTIWFLTDRRLARASRFLPRLPLRPFGYPLPILRLDEIRGSDRRIHHLKPGATPRNQSEDLESFAARNRDSNRSADFHGQITEPIFDTIRSPARVAQLDRAPVS